MRPSPISCLTITLAISACTMSSLDPNADVAVVGAAIDHLDEPLTELKIALAKEPDVGEILGAVLMGPLTVLACLGDEPSVICQDALLDTTDGSGRFDFSLKGSDTQGSIGNASYFNLASGLPPSELQIEGPSLAQRFIINSEYLRLPTLQFWNPGLSIQSDPVSIQVLVDEPGVSDFRVRFEGVDLTSRYVAIWEQASLDGLDLDPRILEDANVSVVAVHHSREELPGGTIEVLRRSASYGFQGTAGAAPSRGAPCWVHAADGSHEERSPCPLTDGDFTRGFAPAEDSSCPPDSPECEPLRANRFAYLDLGGETAIELIVVRLGPHQLAQVQTSLDAEVWTSVGQPGSDRFAIEVPGGTTARFVRVIADSPDGDVIGLAELSVW